MSRVLFDQSVPKPLRQHLTHHAVETAFERGWSALINGDLLRAIEVEGFDVFVTCDQSLRHQQNLESCPFAIVVIGTNLWPVIATDPGKVVAAVEVAHSGAVSFVSYPRPPRRTMAPGLGRGLQSRQPVFCPSRLFKPDVQNTLLKTKKNQTFRNQ